MQRLHVSLSLLVLVLGLLCASSCSFGASRKTDDRLAMAIELLEKGDPDGAARITQEVLRVSPRSEQALVIYAATRDRKKQWPAAAKAYAALLRYYPKTAVAWNNRATALVYGGMWSDEIYKCLDKAIALDPKNPNWYIGKANICVIMGEFDRCIAVLTKACSKGVIIPKDVVDNMTRLTRQFRLVDLPPEDYISDADSFHTVLGWSNKDGLSRAILGATPGVALSVAGSSTSTFNLWKGMEIWDGGVVTDPTYGFLIDNGTHFRYYRLVKGKKICVTGVIENWKPKSTNKSGK